jgi:hypothetical protein
MKEIALAMAIAFLLLASACQRSASTEPETVHAEPSVAAPAEQSASSSPFPNLQAELLDERHKETKSPLGSFDFKNFTYPLPRGWQNPDGSDLKLTDGKVVPVSKFIDEDMPDDEKMEVRATRRIGMSYVTTKYIDLTGDGEDEAIVILKVETTGNAIPQIVYAFEWQDGAPNLIWHFRTGDRADGGLKDIRTESGEVIVELYGQDRFVIGETETSKITGDEEQLCCPTYFTRTFYKWNDKYFQIQRKRLTYDVANTSIPPLENYGDIVNSKVVPRRKR